MRATLSRSLSAPFIWGFNPIGEKYGLRTQVLDAITNADQQRNIQTGGVEVGSVGYQTAAVMAEQNIDNVKIIAGLPGLTTGYGGTHQAIEDLALMRMVPGLTVIDPCDATEIAQATAAIADFFSYHLAESFAVAADRAEQNYKVLDATAECCTGYQP